MRSIRVEIASIRISRETLTSVHPKNLWPLPMIRSQIPNSNPNNSNLHDHMIKTVLFGISNFMLEFATCASYRGFIFNLDLTLRTPYV